MNQLLFGMGIVSTVIGVIALCFSALQRYGYNHLLDGDTERYLRLRRKMRAFFRIGLVLVLIGVLCIILFR